MPKELPVPVQDDPNRTEPVFVLAGNIKEYLDWIETFNFPRYHPKFQRNGALYVAHHDSISGTRHYGMREQHPIVYAIGTFNRHSILGRRILLALTGIGIRLLEINWTTAWD